MVVLPFSETSNVTFLHLFAEIYLRGAAIFRLVYIVMAALPRKGVVYCEDGEDDDAADIHAFFAKRARSFTEGIVASKQLVATAPDDVAG